MYTKILTAILFFIIAYSTAFSQDFKFGKVSIEEVNEKINSQDTSAHATVLYRDESVNFIFSPTEGFSQIKEVHERIKIYDKEGFDWAVKRVNIYKGGAGKSDKINGLSGFTYNLENGKLTKDKLKSDGIFKEQANEIWEVNSFTMPNIKEGSVIEYTYKITSPFLSIDDIVLQYDIPIKKQTFKINTPEYFIYNNLYNPRASYMPTFKNSRAEKTLTVAGKTDYVGSGLRGNNSTSGGSASYFDNILSIDGENVPALKSEPFVSNLNNYRAKLILELTTINYPNSPIKNYTENWESVGKTIYNNPEFGDQINRSNFYKDDISKLINATDDDFQKAFTLMQYVKSKVKWNEMYGYTAQKGIKTAYTEGDGNVADINLLLISMLRSIGVKASPVLISSRNNGIPLFPTTKGFNYVVCIVENAEGYVLLDATSAHTSFNTLPVRAINWQGRVLREDGSSQWINLSPSSKSLESTSAMFNIVDGNNIEGKVRQRKTDYLAYFHRNNYNNVIKEDIIKSFEKDKGDIIISELTIDNANEVIKPIDIVYDFKLNDGVEVIGNNLYVSPMLFFATKESPFKQDKREYPIDYIYPLTYKYSISVNIPEGYAIESLPKSEIIEFKEDSKFSYILKENGNSLQLSINYEIEVPFVQTNDYEMFKQFIERIVEKQNEKVVLKKI